MGIGHFIVFMGVLFLVLAIALFMFISVNLSKQFDSTSMLMDYSAHWNSIFVSMMEVSSILDILPAEEGDEGFARYAEASEKLSQAIDSFLIAYERMRRRGTCCAASSRSTSTRWGLWRTGRIP